MDVKKMWINPHQIPYLNVVDRFVTDDTAFSHFRGHPIYTGAIGQPEWPQAIGFWNKINQDTEIMATMEEFSRLDDVGDPQKKKMGFSWFLSLNLVRYLDSIRLLKENFGDLNNKVIGEVGPGFGGLMYCIGRMWTPKSYWIADLPQVERLVDKVMHHLQTLEPHHGEAINVNTDLTIAEYSITEQDDPLPMTEQYLLPARNIFVRSNIVDDKKRDNWILKLREKFDITMFPEESPNIFGFNQIVVGRS